MIRVNSLSQRTQWEIAREEMVKIDIFMAQVMRRSLWKIDK